METFQAAVIFLYFVILAGLVGTFLYLRHKREKKEEAAAVNGVGVDNDADDLVDAAVAPRGPLPAGGGGGGAAAAAAALRARRGMRARGRGRLDAQAAGNDAAAGAEGNDVADANDDDDLGLDDDDADVDGGGLGVDDDTKSKSRAARLKAEKDRKKLLKQQMREMEQVQREDRQRKEDARDAARRAKEEEREAKERERLEEEARIEEERLKKEEEEYKLWKASLTVEDAGTLTTTSDESQELLQKFLDFIKQHKVVELDELAAEFKMKTQQAVDRIRILEESGRLTGVMDDRGKYIFLTKEELAGVAAFIKKRGRLTINDLVSESNKLIMLAPATSAISS